MASWYLEVSEHGEKIKTIGLSTQTRFLCGRVSESGSQIDSIDIDLGNRNSVSRCALL